MSEKSNVGFFVRDFRESDYAEVNEIWNITGMGGEQRGDNLEVIKRTLNSGGKLLILEDSSNGKVCGTSWLTNDNRRIYLHHFGIHPDYQGKKLSHILTRESVNYAKECGLQIKLEVHKNNNIASSLYKKHGFGYLGDYHVYIIRSFD